MVINTSRPHTLDWGGLTAVPGNRSLPVLSCGAATLPVKATTLQPERQIPAEKSNLALKWSTIRPPRNLLMAYARFWLLVIIPGRQ